MIKRWLPILAFLFFPALAHAQQPSLPQTCHGQTSSTVTSIGCTSGTGTGGAGMDITSTSEIVNGVVRTVYSASASAVTDTLGNNCEVYDSGTEVVNIGGNVILTFFTCTITVTGTGDVFTATVGSNAGSSINVWTVSANGGSVLLADVFATVSITFTTPPCSLNGITYSTVTSSELIVTYCGTTSSSGTTWSAGSNGALSATLADTSNSGAGSFGGVEYATANAPQTNIGATMLTSASNESAAIVFTYTNVPFPPPNISITPSSTRNAINPNVYGIVAANSNFPSPTLAHQMGLPIMRFGGDSATTYNYLYDTQNQGTDLYFIQGSNSTPPAGQYISGINAYRATVPSIQVLGTIPFGPYVVNSQTALASYPIASVGGGPAYGAQSGEDCFNAFQSCTSGTPNVGNGYTTGGSYIPDTDIAYTYTTNTTTLAANFIALMTTDYGNCASGGICYWQLGNEPDNYCFYGRDWYGISCPVPYDTFIYSRGQTYATAIRAADSTAKILGPSGLYGFWGTGYPASPPAPLPAVSSSYAYYLYEFEQNDITHGTRTLDYLDTHIGIGDNSGGHGGNYTTCGMSTADISYDLNQPRTYWDSTFAYQTGIFGSMTGNGWPTGVSGNANWQLFPRFASYATAYYPGTGLSVSEYEISLCTGAGGTNPQGPDFSMVDAINEAYALGVFGYQNLQLAVWYDYSVSADYPNFSFLMYLNFDGASTPAAQDHFGTTSVLSTSSNDSIVSAFGALQPSGNLTIMVINKSNLSEASPIALTGFTPNSTVNVYTYDSNNVSSIAHTTTTAATVASGYTYAPYSETMLVLTPASASPTVPGAPQMVKSQVAETQTATLRK